MVPGFIVIGMTIAAQSDTPAHTATHSIAAAFISTLVATLLLVATARMPSRALLRVKGFKFGSRAECNNRL